MTPAGAADPGAADPGAAKPRMRGPDRGSASIWVLACAALLLLVAGVATLRGVAVVARHRAESAADLAALAGAAQIGVGAAPCAAAAVNAEHNGATLRSCTTTLDADGRSGSVVVRIGLHVDLPVVGGEQVLATARAGRLAASATGGR